MSILSDAYETGEWFLVSRSSQHQGYIISDVKMKIYPDVYADEEEALSVASRANEIVSNRVNTAEVEQSDIAVSELECCLDQAKDALRDSEETITKFRSDTEFRNNLIYVAIKAGSKFDWELDPQKQEPFLSLAANNERLRKHIKNAAIQLEQMRKGHEKLSNVSAVILEEAYREAFAKDKPVDTQKYKTTVPGQKSTAQMKTKKLSLGVEAAAKDFYSRARAGAVVDKTVLKDGTFAYLMMGSPNIRLRTRKSTEDALGIYSAVMLHNVSQQGRHGVRMFLFELRPGSEPAIKAKLLWNDLKKRKEFFNTMLYDLGKYHEWNMTFVD